MFARRAGFVGIAAHEEVFEQVAYKLQCDVLESEGGTVEELEEMEILGGVEGDERCDVGRAEGSITP